MRGVEKREDVIFPGNQRNPVDAINNLEITILRILEGHQGRENAISRASLVEAINIARPLFPVGEREIRRMIKHLQSQHGEGIGSCVRGYFMTQTAEELEKVCAYYDGYALSQLHTSARLRKMALPDLLGQMKLKLEGGK
jgi:hypothetical protein